MRIGVDLGGTKIESIAMGEDGAIPARQRIATPKDYSGTLSAMRDLVAQTEALAAAGPCPVGVGMPGSISPATGLVRNANSTWLNGQPFAQDLAAALARPVRLANDANCFALSEARDGAGAGAACVFGIILGTGCGGGAVIHGQLLEGAGAIAGEWGHTPLPWARPEEMPGPSCWCGRRGCLETWVSGPAFARDYKDSGGVLFGKDLSAPIASGNPLALRALERLADRLARGLAVVIDILDPDCIVLGGGLSNIEALPAMIQARLPAYVFADAVATRVVKNHHGDSSGVRGAAWLWPTGAP